MIRSALVPACWGCGGSGGPEVFLAAKPVPVGGADQVVDGAASDRHTIGIAESGQGAELTGVPAARKLAIRYASESVGTISVAVHDQTARSVNVHSSGSLTGSFLYAIIDLEIPSGITNQGLASEARVLRITHDKGWVNDDDPGTKAPGWLRKANLGTGDNNNDLTTSDTPGVVWSVTFTGRSVSVYAPKEPGAGSIEISIDDVTRGTIDLSTTGARQPRQMVSEVTGLSVGRHTITITHSEGGPVAVDALVIR